MQNILYVNTLSAGGGAAAVMQQLRRRMALRGLHTPLLTGRPAPGEDAALRRQEYGGLFSWCRWRGLLDYHVQKSHALVEHPFFQTADLIHLHNLHGGYFNPWSLPLLTARKPAVWTLHDMQALTGHCAASLECERWLPQTACGDCPRLDHYPRLWRDATRRLWQDKRILYAHSSLHLVTPSVWLQRLTEKSLLQDLPLTCIPNGVDTAIYRPQDKAEARRQLGLPQDALLVGGCADGGLANPWKGGHYVVQTVQALKKEFAGLVFLNIGVKTIPTALQADWIRHIPYVQDDNELATLYAALDLLLYPTLADNHPLVCIESLCCGTPVAGFATGGVPEIVRHGQDGLLAPTHAVEDLIQNAVRLLRDADMRRRMGQEGAAGAAQRYHLNLFVRRYENVYEEALRRPFPPRTGRLPLRAVPAVVRGPAFLRQHWRTSPPATTGERLAWLARGLTGSFCQAAAGLLGWPLQIVRLVRSRLYRHRV